MSNSNPTESPDGSLILFMIGASVIATAMAIVGSHAPPRIRLLGLFSIALGCVAGWAITTFAKRTLKLPEFAWIAFVTLAGLVGCTWRTFSMEPIKPKVEIHPIAAAVAARMNEPVPTEPVPTPAERFHEYLARRVKRLGTWSWPWPEVFWSCELLAGTIASVWVARLCQLQEPGT